MDISRQFECCVVCGVDIDSAPETEMVFEEREEWKQFSKQFKNTTMFLRAEEIERMYFQKDPAIWAVFYRAILHRPKDDHLCISGITQAELDLTTYSPTPVPHDRQKACIGYKSRKHSNQIFARFQMANMLGPDQNMGNGEQIGYPVHAHCWVLLDHIIGSKLVEVNLKTFVKALKQFWQANSEIWNLRVSYELENGLPNTSDDQDCMRFVDTGGNPAIVPEIQLLIEQATHIPPRDDCPQQRLQQSVASQIPLEIAILIIETISRISTKDTENVLSAFGWRLPDRYWQSRCKKDLIFEFDYLIQADKPVDWQYLCLRAEEVLKDHYALKSRDRILRLLRRIKEVFLNMLEQGEDT